MSPIAGFSKLSKTQKIEWLSQNHFAEPEKAKALLETYWNQDEKLQRLHDEFSENTLSNYYLPFSVAPNFKINGTFYTIPMAIEESSVVAAAGKSAKFWKDRSGFKTYVQKTTKNGQVHFMYKGDPQKLTRLFESLKLELIHSIRAITQKMEKRGGGLRDIQLENKTEALTHYYQLDCTFETVDAMGANFINSCLETLADSFEDMVNSKPEFADYPVQTVMAILSNYVPECLVKAEVSCPVQDLHETPEDAREFAEKFVEALNIAKVSPYRAVTHNKGIMNGIDAVVLATGNDFRAVEAGAHAYAARNGQYTSLSHAEITEDDIFRFWIEIPLAMGTVGGLTRLHPLVKLALELLQNPSAKELMQITAVTGLAQNFGAVRSLVTTGIQKGHMKMHLMNILNQFDATPAERQHIIDHFRHDVVSHSAVIRELEKLREGGVG